MKKDSTAQHSQAWPWIGQMTFGHAVMAMVERGDWPATALWSGADHLGKATIARWLAQRDLCHADAIRPCNQCTDCRAILAGTHPDSLVLDGAQEHSLRLEEVQAAMQRLRWKSPQGEGRRRWVVLLDVEKFSESIGNSILKFIEEPPAQTAVIMTSSFPNNILATIRSRGVEFRWHRVPMAELEASLMELFPQQSSIERRNILRHAAGRPGIAVRLARQPEALEHQWDIIQIVLRGLQTGRWPQRREWTPADLDQAESLVRDALLTSSGSTPRQWAQHHDAIHVLSTTLGRDRLLLIAQRLRARHAYLRQHVQPAFILHDLSL